MFEAKGMQCATQLDIARWQQDSEVEVLFRCETSAEGMKCIWIEAIVEFPNGPKSYHVVEALSTGLWRPVWFALDEVDQFARTLLREPT